MKTNDGNGTARGDSYDRDDGIYPRMHYFVFKMAAFAEHSIASSCVSPTVFSSFQAMSAFKTNSYRITEIEKTEKTAG